jgi:hypothetical protein
VKDNIQITITGNYIWARQTGPNSIEVGDVPGRATYDTRTHIVVSRGAASKIAWILADVRFRHTFRDARDQQSAVSELRAALEVSHE